jgi:AraC-like DNA-binding protein
MQAMMYREHPPAGPLTRHIECYWSIQASIDRTTPVTSHVLPDGCMDIIITLGDPVSATGSSSGPAYAVGTMTRPLEVRYAGALHLMGVRFRPGGAAQYLSVDAPGLTDGSTPLDDIWGAEAHYLRERLATAPHLAARVDVLDQALLGRLRDGPSAVDEAVLRAAEIATARGGRASVDSMAEAAGLGRRQLERRFLAAVGIPPKMACRVVRFRDAVARMHACPRAPLSWIALEAGYADQAHFTREFRELAETTPGRYRTVRLKP